MIDETEYGTNRHRCDLRGTANVKPTYLGGGGTVVVLGKPRVVHHDLEVNRPHGGMNMTVSTHEIRSYVNTFPRASERANEQASE